MAVAAPTLMWIGAGLSAASSIFSGIQGMNQAKYQASVAEMNQRIAEDRAKRAQNAAQIEQQEQDAESLALMGAQEAVQGASGLTLEGRSYSQARKSARELARKDALNIRHQGELQAYAARVDAANYKAEAGAARAAGRNSLVGGFLGAGSSLITGASKVAQFNRITNPRTPTITRTRSVVR